MIPLSFVRRQLVESDPDARDRFDRPLRVITSSPVRCLVCGARFHNPGGALRLYCSDRCRKARKA